MASASPKHSSAQKNDRIDLRLPAELKRTIEQAAALGGQSVSAFILGLTIPQAHQRIRDARVIELSERDSQRFFEILEDDQATPSPALMRAFERHQAEVD